MDTKIIVALDYPDQVEALKLVQQLDPSLCRLKVGKQLFTAAGPRFVEELVKRGFPVFLDLKFHDIPTTVGLACAAAANLGVWMMNVHALGGGAMLRAARAALGDAADRPKLIAVTLLTSMSEVDMREIGLQDTPRAAVLRLAKLTKLNGLDGVVCSAQEASMLKQELGKDFNLVTPGIRPATAEVGDQHRVMTPAAALAAGSDYLVIGRPITHAPDPLAALLAIHQDIL
ncbi:orotidine-5'-phosphate decarboxylase [Sulfuriferula nivalis]|uniref:Orotidine 5'-phosphate decarboxylase n=1 Tax=Sulfuriferula nivalis TaxID=2675298 RepID=A0A809SE65_9PROT|nr:orotidine-5'-phosphate decarboxylase [Sulfuriferula nivalis]BBP01147.1 orotidine 5'-phosphate decarboxylase [Sulfuriferula nivalis]